VAGPAPQLDCCDGLLCCDAGDAGECAECCGDGDCPQGTICCVGACREIECCIDDILTGGNPNDRCPDTCTCFEGICVDENQERCRAFCESDKECGKDTCCCKDGTCSAKCCEAFVCASDKDCASGYCCCKDGSCSGTCCGSTPTTPPPGGGTIDTLPNTGTGGAASDPLNLAAGLTVAAGAAAAAARWRAKQSDPSP
jgi:LPXTG cell wall anchor motif